VLLPEVEGYLSTFAAARLCRNRQDAQVSQEGVSCVSKPENLRDTGGIVLGQKRRVLKGSSVTSKSPNEMESNSRMPLYRHFANYRRRQRSFPIKVLSNRALRSALGHEFLLPQPSSIAPRNGPPGVERSSLRIVMG